MQNNMHAPTDEQKAVIARLREGCNVVLHAVPGSGKRLLIDQCRKMMRVVGTDAAGVGVGVGRVDVLVVYLDGMTPERYEAVCSLYAALVKRGRGRAPQLLLLGGRDGYTAHAQEAFGMFNTHEWATLGLTATFRCPRAVTEFIARAGLATNLVSMSQHEGRVAYFRCHHVEAAAARYIRRCVGEGYGEHDVLVLSPTGGNGRAPIHTATTLQPHRVVVILGFDASCDATRAELCAAATLATDRLAVFQDAANDPNPNLDWGYIAEAYGYAPAPRAGGCAPTSISAACSRMCGAGADAFVMQGTAFQGVAEGVPPRKMRKEWAVFENVGGSKLTLAGTVDGVVADTVLEAAVCASLLGKKEGWVRGARVVVTVTDPAQLLLRFAQVVAGGYTYPVRYSIYFMWQCAETARMYGLVY